MTSFSAASSSVAQIEEDSSSEEIVVPASDTRTPEFIGWRCEMTILQLEMPIGSESNICGAHIVKPDMKLVVEGKQCCLECYNVLGALNNEAPVTARQFQRKSKQQYKEVLHNLSPSLAKITGRAAKFRRGPGEIEKGLDQLSEAQKIQALAATDYLSMLAEGISGLYVCRSESLIPNALLKRLSMPDGRVLAMVDGRAKEENAWPPLRCCDIFGSMNCWWRDGQKNFRCAVAGHKYTPWSEEKHKMPGFLICLYGAGDTHYLRAEVPSQSNETKLALLKLMMAEENILSIMHDEISYNDFWEHIDGICDNLFSVLGKHCTRVFCRIPEPEFKAASSAASLGRHVVGQELPFIKLDPDKLASFILKQEGWTKLIDGLFGHFVVEQVADATWTKCSKNQKKMLTDMHKKGEPITYSAADIVKMVQSRVHDCEVTIGYSSGYSSGALSSSGAASSSAVPAPPAPVNSEFD